MSDLWTAQQDFWAGFGLPAAEESTLLLREQGEDGFPRLTYESFGGIVGQRRTLSASLWYRDPDWQAIKRKADDIRGYLAAGGAVVPFDGGALWISLPVRTAFARPGEAGSPHRGLKRMILTVEAECLAAQ